MSKKVKSKRALTMRNVSSMLMLGAGLELLSWSGFVDPLVLARPTAIVRATFGLIVSGDFMYDLWLTCLRVSASVAIGALLGISLGVVFGAVPRAYSYVEGPLHGLRSIPSSALYPVMILLFGVGTGSAIAMAALPAGLIMIVAAVAGVRGAHRGRRDLGRILGLSKWSYLRHIVLWEAVPQIMTGLRASASYALVIIIALELFVGGYTGVGQRLARYQSQYNIESVYATLLVVGSLGYLMNYGLGKLEMRLTHWVGH